ncbi:SNO glutamine amidotransferase [Trichoderma longibrachiatum]|uniref:glutaminase n=1 Tax=Trichoderma longibrachiatum ATCC 18648 TaxID=983965 RepID=A0A2T4C479_TRILO|nr:SNO glutamine amidotransferase [Trichoderma longibrachiatum ATCC 18648]
MMSLTVGVLALQGGFFEHIGLLHRAASVVFPSMRPEAVFTAIEVRTPADLDKCDALIIPGGESTTIAFVAQQSGLLEPLRDFVKVKRKPVWGTCAGLILLAEQANGAKIGGQELIGGLDVAVARNHFGRQLQSFQATIRLPFLGENQPVNQAEPVNEDFPAIFIRAPIVEELLNDNVEVLATVTREDKVKRGSTVGEKEKDDVIAVRQGSIVGMSFHPELTEDPRIHVWWLRHILSTM